MMFSPKVTRRVSATLLSDRADQLFFVCTFVLGAVFITAFKAWGTSPFAPLSLAVLLVAGYGAVSVQSPMLRLPEERVADNCYYLGFLFTLVSLSNALYYFATESYTARALVSDFGVALGSTIAGVVARIVIQQMRIDVELIHARTKESLNEAAQTVTADLHNFIAEVGILSQTFKDTLTSSVNSVSAEIEQSAELARTVWNRLGNHLQEHQRVAEQMELHNRAAIEALGAAVRSVSSTLAGIERDLAAAAQHAAAEINGTKLPVPLESLAKLDSALEQTSEALQSISKKINELDAQASRPGPLGRLVSFLKGGS